jgi:hypothetical protein
LRAFPREGVPGLLAAGNRDDTQQAEVIRRHATVRIRDVLAMKIDLNNLQHTFADKPLLIGGKAMEYYGLRKAGADIDFVVSVRDHDVLLRLYPDNVKDIYGDIGVCAMGFEMWNQICRFQYGFLKQNSLEEEEWLVASVDKMILLKAIAMHDRKWVQLAFLSMPQPSIPS